MIRMQSRDGTADFGGSIRRHLFPQLCEFMEDIHIRWYVQEVGNMKTAQAWWRLFRRS